MTTNDRSVDKTAHTVVSGVFRTSPGCYLRCLARRWFRLYGILLVMPVVAFAIIGVAIDIRFVVVSIAIVFVLIPMVMTLLYYYYMLAPEARRAVLPKRVTIEPGRHIIVDYTDGDGIYTAPSAENIAWSDITRVRRQGLLTVFELRGPRLQLLVVPDSAIS